MIRWLTIMALLFGLAGLTEIEEAEAGPIQIESQSLVAEHKNNRAEFKGSVQLTRDDFELHCDRLVAFYNQKAGGELERAEAYGHVSMQQGEKRGSSNKATYTQSEGLLILIGDARVEDPEGTVEGEKIIHNTLTAETKVQQGTSGGRVHLTFEADGDEGEMPEGKPLP
ncbi:MAG: lipopolysaccharide transport periplasmic protein LptA [Mariprofundaceae bacterium]